MKSKEEVINDSLKLDKPPADYNLIEMHCFLVLKQLTIMFYNKQISKEKAGETKQKILSAYEKQCKEYEFERSMFQEHIQHIKETEMDRTRLRKIINRQDEWANKPAGEGFEEAFDLSIKILNTCFKGEFY